MTQKIMEAQLQLKFADGTIATFDASQDDENTQWIEVELTQQDEGDGGLNERIINYVVMFKARNMSATGMINFGRPRFIGYTIKAQKLRGKLL